MIGITRSIFRPSLSPGNIIGIVWTVIYVLLAISILRFLHKSQNQTNRIAILWLFLVNGALNFYWNYLFFGLQNIDAALVEIFFLNFTTIVLIYLLKGRHPVSALLLVPYFAGCFATYLLYTV
ncbi:MAG: TspO/MBR family protein [Patescibacteria group bacterium]